MDLMMPERDLPTDEFQASIAEAQAVLKQTVEGLTPRDPQRLVFGGLYHLLGVLGRSTQRWEQAVADVISARTLSDSDCQALIGAVEQGAYKSMRKEAQRMLRVFDRSQARNTGLAVGSALVVGLLAGIGLGWWSFAPMTQLTCGTREDGARMCYFYTKLPGKP